MTGAADRQLHAASQNGDVRILAIGFDFQDAL